MRRMENLDRHDYSNSGPGLGLSDDTDYDAPSDDKVGTNNNRLISFNSLALNEDDCMFKTCPH